MKTKTRPKPKLKAKKPKPAASQPLAPGQPVDEVNADEIRGVVETKEIRPSPTNPRKTFPDASLQELADSFGRLGILQPLVVRPVPLDVTDFADADYLEIVDGERRYRAAKLAGVPRVPVSIRWLTDEQVLEAQLIANDQREDVLPSEQAAAYGRLRGTGKTAEQIAATVGKPLAYVRSVLVLARCPASLLDAVDEGKVPRSVAELVARVPGDESRDLVAAHVLAGVGYLHAERRAPKPEKGAEPLSYRATRDFIARHFQVELKSATFSRKALDLVEAAGSCDDCPKRAGNAAKEDEAYAEVRADVCLDPECFRAKTEAHNRLALAAAKESGKTVLPAKEADKLFHNGGECPMVYSAPYVDVEDTCHTAGGKKYKTLLKDHLDKSVVAVDPAGVLRTLIPRDVANKVLRTDHGVKTTNERSEHDVKRDREVKLLNAIRLKCQEQAAAIAGKPVDDWTPDSYDAAMKAVLVALIDWFPNDAMHRVEKRRGWDDWSPPSLTPAEAFGVVAEACVARALYAATYFQPNKQDFGPLLEGLGIKYDEVKKEVEAEQAKPKPAKSAARETKPSEPPASAGFGFA